jgi:hypothetical protein
MDNIKEAFLRVREDILELKRDRDLLEKCVVDNRKKLFEISEMLADLTLKLQLKQRAMDFSDKQTSRQADTQAQQQANITNTPQNTEEQQQTNSLNTSQTPEITGITAQTGNISIYSLNDMLDNQTDNRENKTYSTYSSTYNVPLEGLNSQNLGISKGNGGVQTDKQTNRQTDNIEENAQNIEKNTVDDAIDILSSLDSVRKRLRLDFKALTDQEWLIFSTLYTLEEEQGTANYRSIANKLNLTESSIRDYVARLIKKGIPVDKKKINNKNIALSISENLKKIAPLHQILELRELN